ncbi:MAG: Benzoylformate decarboxylase [Alphaproteobacteria bacterium MarineAlpha2_Bin1]|nr:MAG: Benzoylformate decarboxylase [Alphaproteobacteria bacterium MarineAlpha2_Bin1]
MKSSIEVPKKNKKKNNDLWGSDIIANSIRNIGVPYVTLNPGASFRGLHDSFVNYLGNVSPKIILCLHEEHAVSVAHGYAKVAEKPLATILHSNVGLMHGSMAIFNTFCDRVPVIILGATGPLDAKKRRPWIDWIHTSQDQASLIRNFIKWDNQPGSTEASIEAVYRAANIAQTFPKGPVYVCFDVTIQEEKINNTFTLPSYEKFKQIGNQFPSQEDIIKAKKILLKAKKPIIFYGRVSRNKNDWKNRILLAEKLGATVFTDRKNGASFPTNHELHSFPPLQFLSPKEIEFIKKSDAILSLDWVDLAGTISQVWSKKIGAKIINVSLDNFVHNGWSMDHQGFPPSDLRIHSTSDSFISILLKNLQKKTNNYVKRRALSFKKEKIILNDNLNLNNIAECLKKFSEPKKISFLRLPGGWPFSEWPLTDPLSFIGYDGGGGIGSGPGMSVGSALAFRDLYPKRLPISIIGDGDYLMGINALWTAAHYKIPLLIIVANNQSYFNDEMHQDRVALERGRNRENKWIGQKIVNPEVDLAKLAISQGLKGIGPIKTLKDLEQGIIESINLLKAGYPTVLDVIIGPRNPLVFKNKN